MLILTFGIKLKTHRYPMMVNGLSVPLDDTRVLTANEVAEIQATITGYNGTISALASQSGWAMFDAHSFFEELGVDIVQMLAMLLMKCV